MCFSLVSVKTKPLDRERSKDLSLDYMLAITASLTSGNPDQEQKFRTSEEDYKHLEIRLPAEIPDNILQQKPRNLIRNTVLMKLHPSLSQKRRQQASN